MIKENNSIRTFNINLERTNMLIQAVEKITAYNFLYQEKAVDVSLEYRNVVKSVQDKELAKISKSCHEHAIISIATAFETYLKELVQELLFKYGEYFKSQNTKWHDIISKIINDSEDYDNELILMKLKLSNRFQIIDFLKYYKINLLNQDQQNLISAIYIKRNDFVHNGSTLSKKAIVKMEELNNIDENKYLDLSIKWTRTKFKRMVYKAHGDVIKNLNNTCEK